MSIQQRGSKRGESQKLFDLKEASEIEQDAGLVLRVYNSVLDMAGDEGNSMNTTGSATEIEIAVLKQREGKVGEEITLELDNNPNRIK